MNEVILKVNNMSKSFGITKALRNVSLELRKGEILGLIGENGSGKSTVSSIVAGMQKADEGTMEFKNENWQPESMIDSLEKGIGMIVQESGTVPGITVAENIFLADVGQFKKNGFIDRKEMNNKAQEILNSIGEENINSSMPTALLDMQDRKLIEIARVMRKQPDILIVDETTTALSQHGRDIIYSIMNKLRDENKSVIFISHDMEEIMHHTDRLTVLRDGQIIRAFEKDEYDEGQIKTSMIGRELEGDYYRSDYDDSCSDEVGIKCENITVNSSEPLFDISLEVHKGEIVGIGGLSSCGMHTLGKVLFGNIKPEQGKVTVNDSEVKDENDAMKKGVGYVSKNRDYESLVLNAPINDNIASGGLDKFSKGILILPNEEKKYVEKQIKNLEIKCNSREDYVSSLSGGNKQKVVFGKWIGRGSDILILDCPTRGIDIGVKQSMYQLMTKMKNEGKSIIIISEEMSELIGMSDRIIILKEGRMTAEFKRSSHPEESDIIGYMI